jgi:hypothetical protein
VTHIATALHHSVGAFHSNKDHPMSALLRLPNRPLRGLAIAVAAAALVACGSDDDGGGSTTLGGVAAVGSPIVGGSVDVRCASGSPLSATTGDGGAWQVTISGQTLPCAVQVQGGTAGGSANTEAWHSIAFDFGNVNVTPLTELVLARSLAGNPQAWFAAPSFAGLNAAAVETALSQVVAALGVSSALDGANPLTARFQAVSGNAIDDVLEALSSALQTLGTDFAALLVAAGSGDFSAFAGMPGAITTALNAGGGGGGGGGGGSTSCSTGTEMIFARGQAAGPYTDGQKACVQGSATSLTIDGKTLTNPTQNTVVSAPFAAYVFVDAGLNYELVLNNGALYEINIAKPDAISGADFHGQFAPTSAAGSSTLTLEVSVSGVVSSSIQVPNQVPPTSQSDFCSDIASDPNLVGLQAQGISLTITSCSFSGNVGTIQATAQTGGVSVPYTVRFIYGS